MAKTNSQNTIIDTVRENYQSIILGLIVFLIAASAVYRSINKQPTVKTENNEAISVEKQINDQGQIVTDKYTVRRGDTLWKIAQMKYGSGYNFVDVARENKIKNLNRIETGQVLMMPKVAPKMLTRGMVAKTQTSKVTLTGDSYKVQKGDHLWKIAVAAYGDGYAWVKIAQTNHLRNPNRIVAGQVLKLPRN